VKYYDYNCWDGVRKTAASLAIKSGKQADLIQPQFPLYFLLKCPSSLQRYRINPLTITCPAEQLSTYPTLTTASRWRLLQQVSFQHIWNSFQLPQVFKILSPGSVN